MLNATTVTNSVLSRIRDEKLGIDLFAGGEESQTSKLIKIMVEVIISAIKADARVDGITATMGGPSPLTNGKIS